MAMPSLSQVFRCSEKKRTESDWNSIYLYLVTESFSKVESLLPKIIPDFVILIKSHDFFNNFKLKIFLSVSIRYISFGSHQLYFFKFKFIMMIRKISLNLVQIFSLQPQTVPRCCISHFLCFNFSTLVPSFLLFIPRWGVTAANCVCTLAVNKHPLLPFLRNSGQKINTSHICYFAKL